jgi:hypothetical protein
MGYSVIEARRNREHKLATIGSKITLCMTSTNVREVLQMESCLNSWRLGQSESRDVKRSLPRSSRWIFGGDVRDPSHTITCEETA